MADKIVEVRDGELHRYEGGYSAWRERKVSADGAGRSGGVPTGAPRAKSF
jgi:ATPase subunit of ABC transporter with duplicated ATPase domains